MASKRARPMALASPATASAERLAIERVVSATQPHVAGMLHVLVEIAMHSRREMMRAKAASKVLEMHLEAVALANKRPADDGGVQRMLVINNAALDQVESLQRAASTLTAEAVK